MVVGKFCLIKGLNRFIIMFLGWFDYGKSMIRDGFYYGYTLKSRYNRPQYNGF